jgi:hypothetical protein
METLEHFATWLYWYCVDFMVNAANLLELTYRDTNSLMFFVIWPAVTVMLLATVVFQRIRIWRGGGGT